MKKLGEGWQYTVYDLENGKVLKKFHSWPKSYWVILKMIFPFKQDSMWEIPGFIKSMKRKAIASFEIIHKKNIPKEWLANPTFLKDYDFEQDKVQPLHDFFEESNFKDSIKIIDQFIEFNLKLLEFGVIDKSFNITKNYGIDKNGEIVLIDIGEIFDNHTKIQKQIIERAWDKDYVAGCIKDPEVRKYFIEKMNSIFVPVVK